MRNYYIVILILLAAVIFIPFYPVNVVPEWELQFVNKDNTPSSSIRIDQIWKDFSLGWMSGENIDKDISTDSDGRIKLPARHIRISFFQFLSSFIRDALMSINPHASFGSHSYIICKGEAKCVVSYKEDNEKPQRVVLW